MGTKNEVARTPAWRNFSGRGICRFHSAECVIKAKNPNLIAPEIAGIHKPFVRRQQRGMGIGLFLADRVRAAAGERSVCRGVAD